MSHTEQEETAAIIPAPKQKVIAKQYIDQFNELILNMKDNCADCFFDDKNHFLRFKDGSVIVEPYSTFSFAAEDWETVSKNADATPCSAPR